MDNSDTKTNTFTEEGRILQVEYAIKNVSKAGTMIGMVCKDGVLLIGLKKSISTTKKEKIYKISDNIYCTISGISSDALQLLGYARVQSENFRENLGMEMPIKSLCISVGELKQSFTQGGGLRPFGVSFLYAGIFDDKYLLYSTDPSGSVIKWRAVCYGEMEDGINGSLKNDLTGEYSLEEGTKELLKILKKVREIKDEDLKLLEIFHFKKDKKVFLTEETIKKYLA